MEIARQTSASSFIQINCFSCDAAEWNGFSITHLMSEMILNANKQQQQQQEK